MLDQPHISSTTV